MKYALTHVEKNDIENGTITIPENITSIQKNAFYGLEDLKSVTLPKSLFNIDSAAFHGCPNLEKVIFSSLHFSINENAFYKCDKLTEIYLPVCSDPQVIMQATQQLRTLKNRKKIAVSLYLPNGKTKSKDREL